MFLLGFQGIIVADMIVNHPQMSRIVKNLAQIPVLPRLGAVVQIIIYLLLHLKA